MARAFKQDGSLRDFYKAFTVGESFGANGSSREDSSENSRSTRIGYGDEWSPWPQLTNQH